MGDEALHHRCPLGLGEVQLVGEAAADDDDDGAHDELQDAEVLLLGGRGRVGTEIGVSVREGAGKLKQKDPNIRLGVVTLVAGGSLRDNRS